MAFQSQSGTHVQQALYTNNPRDVSPVQEADVTFDPLGINAEIEREAIEREEQEKRKIEQGQKELYRIINPGVDAPAPGDVPLLPTITSGPGNYQEIAAPPPPPAIDPAAAAPKRYPDIVSRRQEWDPELKKYIGVLSARGTGPAIPPTPPTPQEIRDRQVSQALADVWKQTGVHLDRDEARDAELEVFRRWRENWPYERSFLDNPRYLKAVEDAKNEAMRRVGVARGIYKDKMGQILSPTVLKENETLIPSGEGDVKHGTVRVPSQGSGYIFDGRNIVPLPGGQKGDGQGETQKSITDKRVAGILAEVFPSISATVSRYASLLPKIIEKVQADDANPGTTDKVRKKNHDDLIRARMAQTFVDLLAPNQDASKILEAMKDRNFQSLFMLPHERDALNKKLEAAVMPGTSAFQGQAAGQATPGKATTGQLPYAIGTKIKVKGKQYVFRGVNPKTGGWLVEPY